MKLVWIQVSIAFCVRVLFRSIITILYVMRHAENKIVKCERKSKNFCFVCVFVLPDNNSFHRTYITDKTGGGGDGGSELPNSKNRS